MSTVAETGGPRARLTDPNTSHEAADGSNLAASQAAVLALLEVADTEGMTQPELIAALPEWSESRVRSAVSELVAMGSVVDAGFARLTVHGYRSRVWMLARFEEEETAA
jgi:hypothetical protein